MHSNSNQTHSQADDEAAAATHESSLGELHDSARSLSETLQMLDEEIQPVRVELIQMRKERGYLKASLTRARNSGITAKIQALETEIAKRTALIAPKEKKIIALETRRKTLSRELKELTKLIRDKSRQLKPLTNMSESDLETYATALANAIESELTLLDERILADKRTGEKTWYDTVPPRSELGRFSCSDRVKERLGIDESVDFISEVPLSFQADDSKVDSKLFEWFFCMVHCGFEPRSATDMDHADPYDHVRENQQRLLGFLNTNISFARTFIQQEGMDLYFKEENGKILASNYFFEKSYNAIDNLWLLCHVCNLNKGAENPIKWLSSKLSFDHAFAKSVDAQGGFHQGVLIDRIYTPSEESLAFETENGEPVHLFSGKACELGAFVRQWFKENKRAIYETAKRFEGGFIELFRRGLAMVLRADNPDEERVMSRRLKNSLLLLSPSFEAGATVKKAGSLSSSGSDGEQAKRVREMMAKRICDTMLELRENYSEFKRIRKLLTQVFEEAAEPMCRKLEVFLASPTSERMSSTDLKNLGDKLNHAIHSFLGTTSVEATGGGEASDRYDWEALDVLVNQEIEKFGVAYHKKFELTHDSLSVFGESHLDTFKLFSGSGDDSSLSSRGDNTHKKTMRLSTTRVHSPGNASGRISSESEDDSINLTSEQLLREMSRIIIELETIKQSLQSLNNTDRASNKALKKRADALQQIAYDIQLEAHRSDNTCDNEVPASREEDASSPQKGNP